MSFANDLDMIFQTAGGRVMLYDWDSNELWSYSLIDSLQCMHHDVYPLPNGNVLALVWEKKTRAQAIAAGRNPKLLGTYIWAEKIIELKPKGKNDAKIVWEWKAWDHLIQDHDSTKANFGTVAEHPEKLDFNFEANESVDWLHFNSIAFNARLNQIMVSNRNYNEIFILDHSTNSKQAATNKGGKQKKGGDLLYRWGNPQTYRAGEQKDKQFFRQHSAVWIDKGLPGEGKIMVFNNGLGRPELFYSSVDVISPPITKNGSYSYEKGKMYAPQQPEWSYQSQNPENFFSKNVSGAQRLSNGNTLICSGANGKFFEIDSTKKTVWLYINPVNQEGPHAQRDTIYDNRCFRAVFYESNYAGFKKQKTKFW